MEVLIAGSCSCDSFAALLQVQAMQSALGSALNVGPSQCTASNAPNAPPQQQTCTFPSGSRTNNRALQPSNDRTLMLNLYM
jgi:hypothetical protein